MDALDVISLQDAKDWLVVTDSIDDPAITQLIKTAIAWVEQYTCYRLYTRDETFVTTSCKTSYPYFPINSKSIKLEDGTDFTGTYIYGSLELKVECPVQSTVTLNTGYSDPTLAPSPLIDAAKKLIVYLYENRDAYQETIPYDIQMLLNQYRRSATI